MKEEIKINNDDSEKFVEQLNPDHRKELVSNQEISLMDDKRVEECDMAEKLSREVGNGGEKEGIMRKLSEVVGKNKLLRGAIVAGALLTVEPALGQVVANNKEVNNAMTNFMQGIRVEKKTDNEETNAQRKFAGAINNPGKQRIGDVEIGDQKMSEEEFVKPKKGTSEYYLWKLMPGTREEKEKVIKERRRKQKKEQTGKVLSEGQLKEEFNAKDIRYNLRAKQPVRHMVSPEITLHMINAQKQQRILRQDLLHNQYNLRKSNVQINPNANIGNINANSGARVEVGPNVQAGNIEADDGADVQIGTVKY